MKKVSVKLKITVWLTLLMILLWGVLLIFMLSISTAVADRNASELLSRTVRSNLSQVSMTEGTPELGTGFQFYHSGVSTLIYSRNKTLLAGQIPVSFTADEEFQSGTIRTVADGESRYLVLDMWVPIGWDDGFWIRGLAEAPESQSVIYNLLGVSLLALPLFILLAALGSYQIARRAFRPLDSITATAVAINEARDLSRRIGLPPGKDEFSRLAETFDQLFERLERSFEAETQFTADASHELRTPVSIIKGACEYAQKYDETEEERQETLAMIHRQTEKMSNLIAQLLSMTRLEQGTEPARFELLDLADLAETHCAEQGFDPECFTVEIKEKVTVKGDPVLLSRLLQNLIENAFKYGKPGGHVWVSVGRQKQEAFLSVRDDGIGIPGEQQEKIWQRFYQVDPARSGEQGSTGLGLAMVRQIALIHGGRMTLESIPDMGSVFTLYLPCAESPGSKAT